jgi:hypothetical protein
MHANKNFKKFKKIPQLLSIIVYLTTFFALSLSLFLSLSLSLSRAVEVVGGWWWWRCPLSLSLEKSVSFLSDDVAFVVVFVLLLFQSFFRFIF